MADNGLKSQPGRQWQTLSAKDGGTAFLPGRLRRPKGIRALGVKFLMKGKNVKWVKSHFRPRLWGFARF